ncbi:sensor histidine kinase [Rudaeicoccus suwonensis]|uniref:histidine kinase n=1 Tax=Rudaeicoccus suwonensis TaxID=657409 RepID=A0A561E982_9MICO|nr:PAS domain-containing sensor histidine kinase [Rudaeicoccus suwonensis]TWE12172.1 two-component sensor histidine kinase [Rudaeicoccus suwonensis]
MPSMNDVLSQRTDLSQAGREWLHLLVSDWQLLADLSFADLVLWVPTRDADWVAVAHVRPTTGVGVFVDDLVGQPIDRTRSRPVAEAFAERRIVRSQTTMWRDDLPVREESIPVVFGTSTIAVLTRHTNLASMRTPSRLEVTYLATADALARMVATGDFPDVAAAPAGRRGAPRVGDGVLRLDADGVVTYASPNAVSAIHRLGHEAEIVGVRLATILRDLLPGNGPVDEELTMVLTGRVPWRTEVESRSANVSARSIPLSESGRRIGAVLLVRDVSELRGRERELLSKETTIREIHHRVKNNLQTVAAVLRLQSRRLADPQAQAALAGAVRRVATIATVHETLSGTLDETVSFDEVAASSLRAAVDISNRSQERIRAQMTGSFGVLHSDDATAVAMITAELVQNAIEHGFGMYGGTVVLDARRSVEAGGADLLTVTVTDDGSGLPAGFSPGASGLGIQIVQSFVQDLRGEIDWCAWGEHGTRVRFVARLRG